MTLRSGRWKLITALGSGGFSKPRRVVARPGGPDGQLYDLVNDRAETTNLYLQQPDVVRRLKDELARSRASGRSRP